MDLAAVLAQAREAVAADCEGNRLQAIRLYLKTLKR